jgi:glutathione S-transferase
VLPLSHRFDAVVINLMYPESAFSLQASGQGPYYGQAAWFKFYHGERLSSAMERYQGEIVRVLFVLESVLTKQEWFVASLRADLPFGQTPTPFI